MLGVVKSCVTWILRKRDEMARNRSIQGQVACCFGDGIGPSGFIKCGEFLDYLRNYKLARRVLLSRISYIIAKNVTYIGTFRICTNAVPRAHCFNPTYKDMVFYLIPNSFLFGFWRLP
jgi:hypothetical protein